MIDTNDPNITIADPNNAIDCYACIVRPEHVGEAYMCLAGAGVTPLGDEPSKQIHGWVEILVLPEDLGKANGAIGHLCYRPKRKGGCLLGWLFGG